MPLIALSCPNCQANIDLDDSREFGFCSYCGTKLMLQDVKRDVQIDDARRLNNLVDMAVTTLPHESAQNVEKMARRILELDSSNWYGWFLKGASEAKSHNCKAMYEYWTKAIDGSSQQDFDSVRDGMIDLASISLISEAHMEVAEPTRGFIQSFERSSGGECFSCELIRHIIRDVDMLTPFQAGYLVKYVSRIVSAEIRKDGDIRPFLGSVS